MPEARVNGVTLSYDEQGRGGEAVLFAHGLFWCRAMYVAQMAALAERWRCIAYDLRGHGRSESTAAGYDLDNLTRDAAELIGHLGCAPCHFVGHSMGGFIGLRLALRHPELLRSLVLVDSSAEPEPPAGIPRYRLLNFIGRYLGLSLVTGPVMKIMFGRRFLADPARRAELREWRQRFVANDRRGATRSVEAVIARAGVAEQLGRITLPTLVLVGDDDVATVPARSEALHAGITGSRLARFPGVGHSPPIEAPAEVSRVLGEFFGGLSPGR
jgi:3-oxoadipate enol-lactonase